jgi:hypothetical protein
VGGPFCCNVANGTGSVCDFLSKTKTKARHVERYEKEIIKRVKGKYEPGGGWLMMVVVGECLLGLIYFRNPRFCPSPPSSSTATSGSLRLDRN